MNICSPKSLGLGGALLALGISAWSSSALAATLTVSTTGNDTAGAVPNDCIAAPCATIGHAVNMAVANDDIDILAGTYTLTAEILIDKNLRIRGAGKTQTIVDAAGLSRHFFINNSANDVTIADMTLQNGVDTDGGAIRCSSCNHLTLRRIKAVDNIASGFGGAVYTNGSDLTIQSSTLHNNNADSGGAIYKLSGDLIIRDSELGFNVADSTDGGAVFSNAGRTRIVRSTLAYNDAAGTGGGVSLASTQGNALVVLNSTFSGNSAVVGGGVYLENPAEAGIANATFYGNQNNLGGAALHNAGSPSFSVHNSIITASVGSDCSGVFTISGNLVDSATCGGVANPVNGLDSNLLYNGGSTRTHHLIDPLSNAVDSGVANCPAPSSGTPLIYDQHLTLRPLGGNCDVGAVEAF